MSMTFTAFTTCDNKDKATRIAGALEKICPAPFGVGIFELEDGSNIYEIGSYFLEKPNDIKLTLLSSAFNAKPFVVSEVPETDWVAHVKRELPPVNAGRFSILGSHDFDKASRENVNLVIDAAMAFGTGHHATTKGCLLALEKLVKNKFKPIFTKILTSLIKANRVALFSALSFAKEIDDIAWYMYTSFSQTHPVGQKRRNQFGVFDMSIENGERNSTAKAYLDPARTRKNLTVITNTQVQKILFNGIEATGISCLLYTSPSPRD